jgi:hypothetical protein
MRQIIKRILDQILNPITQQMLTNNQESSATDKQEPLALDPGQAVEAFDSSVFDPGTYDNGLDNLDWLNSVDWSRGPWIDLGGQDLSAARWN